MEIISLQTAIKKNIEFNGKVLETGFFKEAYQDTLFLNKDGVEKDFVADKINHGGIEKACYLYGFNNYNFWKNKYPNIQFKMGQFGENITLSFVDDSEIHIGDEYNIGDAIIVVTQPRRPCYKMGIAFENQNIVKEFKESNFPGIYVKIIKEGKVRLNDRLTLNKRLENSPTLLEVFHFIYSNSFDEKLYKKIIENEAVAEKVKTFLKDKWKNFDINN